MSTLHRIFNLLVDCDELLQLPVGDPSENLRRISIRFTVDSTRDTNWEVDRIEHMSRETLVYEKGFGTITYRTNAIDVCTATPLSTLRKSCLISDNLLPLLLTFEGALVLHASAVSENGIGRCFIGPSMSGKSTRAALSLIHGHSVLSQDVTVLQWASNERSINILPGSRLVTLRPESAAYCGQFLSAIGTQEDKIIFEAPAAHSTPLSELYLLRDLNDDSIAISPTSLFTELLRSSLFGKYYSEQKPELFMWWVNIIFQHVSTQWASYDRSFSLCAQSSGAGATHEC